ncbi:cytochrome P450 [Haloechinothrix alba]|uniref:cytochrome P450 n=1 Tax=Haloechinothrix alba TaxID=664784 RepID=UPI001FE3D309|nr:cytochrome P450 [Haloechinothrix alba]
MATLEFWGRTAEERETTFKELRDERPVSWHPPLEGNLLPLEKDGIWIVVRHADVVSVSKDWETFSSAQGVTMEEMPEDMAAAASSFLGMDPPRHTRLRRLVSSAFTPKQVKKIDDQINNQARRIVDDLLDVGDCDFVAQVSKRLPMWTIFEMLGVPQELREEGYRAADGMVAYLDEDAAAGQDALTFQMNALMTLLNIGVELAEERRARPTSDLMTNLVQAEVDGERLTDEEIGAFFVLLSVAGNDTTRNTTSLTMKALCDFPDQRKLLLEDYDGRITTAIEEFVRWATPVQTFRRTVTRDTELNGQKLHGGDWVVTVFASANRDERVFDDPHAFNILRSPNPHVAFGGGGPHYCLGNMLAKTQLRHLFKELLFRVKDIEVGAPTYLTSHFIRGVRAMPCTFTR